MSSSAPVPVTQPAPQTPAPGAQPDYSEDALLDLALDAFADGGYKGTSVRQMCRALGVSHNLVHERYGSKERLWYAAVDHGFRTLASALADAAMRATGDQLDRLRAILVRYVEATAQRPALIRIINTEAAGDATNERLRYIFERYIQPAHMVADVVLRELEHAGRARRLSPAALHFLVGHGAGGMVSLPALASQFSGDQRSLTDQAREAVDVVLRGILK